MVNGCIFLISARKHLLKKCLTFLNTNYNKRYNYPIHIFYHGSKYDDNSFRKSIKNINNQTEYHFHKIEAKRPDHLTEKDMFWNLPNNGYAKRFTKNREGYLHANYFWNNFMNYEELKQYDYLMRIDDDSWFKKPIDFDLFEKLNESNKILGTGYSWNHVNKGVIETRYKFYDWLKSYLKKFNITETQNKKLIKYLNQGENDLFEELNVKYNKNFHTMKHLSGNFNLYNRKMFEMKEWNQYLKDFNDLAGGYRYRWGDCELISMFYYIHVGEEFLDLDLKNKDIYNNQIDNKWDCVKDKDLS